MQLLVVQLLVSLVIAASSADAQDPSSPSTTTPSPTPSATPPVRLCHFVCLDFYEPVCGSDGITYSNSCFLSLADCKARLSTTPSKITEIAKGKCATKLAATTAKPVPDMAQCDNIICTMDYQPVCGSDGKTYSNSCELRRGACKSLVPVTKTSDGGCVDCTQVCAGDFTPVCGSDGVTYSNLCVFENAQCANATLSYVNGTCIGNQ